MGTNFSENAQFPGSRVRVVSQWDEICGAVVDSCWKRVGWVGRWECAEVRNGWREGSREDDGINVLEEKKKVRRDTHHQAMRSGIHTRH